MGSLGKSLSWDSLAVNFLSVEFAFLSKRLSRLILFFIGCDSGGSFCISFKGEGLFSFADLGFESVRWRNVVFFLGWRVASFGGSIWSSF
jgi:hypothetical protein